MANYDAIVGSLIAEYTSEIEKLDALSTTYAMTVIAFVGVIFGLIVTMMYYRMKQKQIILANNQEVYGQKLDNLWYCCINGKYEIKDVDTHTDRCRNSFCSKSRYQYKSSFDEKIANLNRAISVFYAMIPQICTLYLYTLSLNTRKAAIYRGYLRFLEEVLSKSSGINMTFDNMDKGALGIALVGQWGSILPTQAFMTNTYGLLNLFLVVAFIYIISLRLSWYFSNFLVEINVFRSRFGKAYRGLIILSFLSIIFSIMYMSDMCYSNEYTQRVYELLVGMN